MEREKRHRFTKKFSSAKIILPLFVLMFTFFLSSLFRMSALLSGKEHLFYSDFKEIADTMRAITFRGDMVKHLLFSLTTSPFVSLIKTLTPLDENQAILVVIALFASLNVIAAYLTLRLFLKDEILPLFFSLLLGFSFTNLIHFSISETYVVTALVIIVYFYLLIKFQDFLTLKRVAAFFLFTAIAPFYNPPLLLLLIPTGYIYFRNFKWKKFLTVLTANGLFVAGVISIPYLFIPYLILPHTRWAPLYDVEYPIKYVKIWASFSHFTSIKDIANTVGNFLFFSLISPFQELKAPSNFLVDIFSYFDSVIGAISIIAYTGFMGLTGFFVLKKRSHVIDSALLFILSMIFFYIFFFPGGAIMYSTQVVFPLILIFSWMTKNVEIRSKYIFLILFLLLVVINNLISLYGPIVLTQ